MRNYLLGAGLGSVTMRVGFANRIVEKTELPVRQFPLA